MIPQPTHGGSFAERTGDIVVRGARLHNLKNLTVAIPQYSLTVVTGVSGSGKSSLAFDTIYAEGQRRYVESLSAYARQFLERMEKPAVDEIDGIAPAIAIRQKNTTRNPRSTVATSTEIWDYMRLLWARAGRTYCPVCGRQVQRDTVDQVAQTMLAQPKSTRFLVLFPVSHETGGVAPKDRLLELRARGFNRLWQNGTTFEFSTPESLLGIDWTQPVFVLADRIAIDSSQHQRLVDTVETCYRESGEVIFLNASTGERLPFSEGFRCKFDNLDFAQPEPILFSFNSPAGACRRCQGFGQTIDYSLDLVVPDRGLSIDAGAVEPWTKPSGQEWLDDFRKKAAGRVRFDVAFGDLTAAEQRLILDGDRKTKLDGIRQYFNYLETKKYKVHVRVLMSRYRGYTRCPDCDGSRLRAEALNVRVGGDGGITIADAARFNIAQAANFFSTLKLTPEEAGIAGTILTEIAQRLKFLNDVGLEYLTLDRLSATLSGGEAQRIQLATCLGSRLVGACYVLDEPSIGLHSRDTQRLVNILTELRDIGNTILVVEHDPEVMKAADHIIDLGPGAGEYGGTVVFEGDYAGLIAPANQSLTGKYLRGELKVSHRKHRRRVTPKGSIKFFGARMHNLKGIDVAIPLGLLTVVTGVSGSGKSTLVHDVIYKSLQAKLSRAGAGESDEAALDNEDSPRMTCTRVEGASRINDVVMIDQTPIGRTPRSNPVTYIKAFDSIRNIFAATRDAEKRGYAAGHFSFNVPGGRCETCQGDGTVTVEMQFLADVELVCDDCKGTRFKSAILDIRYKGLNVHEVLQLSVTEAIKFFHDTPRLASRLKLLEEAGLGYLRLGQSATTLSGGEAQRVKLAAHLAQATNEGTLFICDEPTTGLHFDDITKLLAVFERLIDHGGTLLVIEHNAEVIRAADWVIDLGPEGGEAGGRILAEGTPEQVALVEGSHTARFLRTS